MQGNCICTKYAVWKYEFWHNVESQYMLANVKVMKVSLYLSLGCVRE